MSIIRNDITVIIQDSSEYKLIVGTAGDAASWVNFITGPGGLPVRVTTREEAEAIVSVLRAVFPDAGEGPC